MDQSPNQFWSVAQESWGKALAAFSHIGKADGVAPQLSFDPEKVAELQNQYISEATELWNQSLQGKPQVKDRRFSAEAWATDPMAAFAAASYLLNTRTLMALTDAAQTDPKTKARIQFAVEQWAAAVAPSNFLAFNAEAQKKAIETQGESIAKGMQNLLKDMQQGHVSMTDESVFEVGKNVATSEGKVVFENDYFQLLEYKPLTGKVYERPFLLIPPCINKFYILDLQPTNSFIRYAVSEGHRTFVVSWRNPDASMSYTTWDDLISHVAIKAIHVVKEIAGSEQINALGFCVGGTILSTALGVLAARDEHPVASATLLTTLVDFQDTGVLDVFIDEAFVQYREAQFANGGLMKGQDMASTFSFLRPNDLVWNYVVGNYLKGETPPPFDLLYWNSDATNLVAGDTNSSTDIFVKDLQTGAIQRVSTAAGTQQLRDLIQTHVDKTGSVKGKAILANWEASLEQFWQIVPPAEKNTPEVNPALKPQGVASKVAVKA